MKPSGDPTNPARMANAQLLRASKAFVRESRSRSWLHLWVAITLAAALIAITCLQALPLYARIAASLLAGLMLVRLFIIYHDHQHGTILKGSPLATILLTAYGVLTLNPPSIWQRSHNHHHKHNAKIFGASIGSFPVMTVAAYASAGRSRRALYAASRHPLTILGGYLTVFLYGMCVRSLLAAPRAHLDSAVALAGHAALVIFLAWYDPTKLALALLLPSAVAAAAGAYLFYAQHNYPGVRLQDRARWDYVDAALESSSYVRMGPLMSWFTGNIGYHHVHHLNARIPFYRLPEAMEGLEPLRNPKETSLSLRDIGRCFGLKLWDTRGGRMVGFPGRGAGTRGSPVVDQSLG